MQLCFGSGLGICQQHQQWANRRGPCRSVVASCKPQGPPIASPPATRGPARNKCCEWLGDQQTLQVIVQTQLNRDLPWGMVHPTDEDEWSCRRRPWRWLSLCSTPRPMVLEIRVDPSRESHTERQGSALREGTSIVLDRASALHWLAEARIVRTRQEQTPVTRVFSPSKYATFCRAGA